MDLVNSQDMANVYIGYARHDKYIWTVEFIMRNPPPNENVQLRVVKFKLLSIEDENGKMLRKIPQFSINSEYYLRKHPLIVFLKRENLDFHNFYGKNRNKYETFTGEVTEYFDDGTVFLSYYLINGKLNGNFTSYYNKTGIREESYFIDGVRHGKATFFHHRYGDIICQFNMGEIISYDFNISKEMIYNIYETYFCSLNEDERDNISDTLNIDTENYKGTIIFENEKIISNTIIFTEEYSKKIINETFSIIPGIIIDRYHYNYLSY